MHSNKSTHAKTGVFNTATEDITSIPPNVRARTAHWVNSGWSEELNVLYQDADEAQLEHAQPDRINEQPDTGTPSDTTPTQDLSLIHI